MNRRKIIKTMLLGAMGLSLSVGMAPLVFGQSQTSDLHSRQLTENLYLLQGAGGNIVVYVGAEGLILVDSGNASMAEELLTYLETRFGTAKVPFLFNTHWHLEQTGANELLANTGTEIIAHENTRLWMGTEVISRWEGDQVYSPRSKKTLPTKTFYTGRQTLSLDGTPVEYGHLPQAHTDGDIYVYFPEQNIMVGGDVVSGGTYPLFDYSSGGWIGGMINSLQILLDRTDENTLFIPASGKIRNRADIEAQKEMCLFVLKGISANYYAGSTYAEYLTSSPMQGFDQRWGDPALFLETAYEGSWWHVNELRRFR